MTVTRRLKKFRLGCKNLDDQATSGRPKSVDPKSVPQASPVSSNRRVSGEFSISQSGVLHDLMAKAFWATELYSMQQKYCKTFDSAWY